MMASVRIAGSRSTELPRHGFEEYSRVALTAPVTREGVTLAVGAEGVIVHDHADGSYSVGFEKPMFDVVTIYATELKAIA
jgi:hypothetical protein